jgi:DNA-binding winged helix-turn-helix (wHTH) protein
LALFSAQDIHAVLLLLQSCQIRAGIAQIGKHLAVVEAGDPSRLEFEFMLIRALHDQQERARLYSLCESICASSDERPQALINMGFSRILLGDPVRAMVAYRNAERALDPTKDLTAWLRAVMGRINCVAQISGARMALEQFETAQLEAWQSGTGLSAVNQISIVLLKACLQCEAGDFHGALNLYWKAYGLVSQCGSLHLNYSLLFDLAKAHLMIGEVEASRHYFSLVEKGINPLEMVLLSSKVAEYKAQMPFRIEELVFDRTHGRVMVGQNKWVDFGRQALLLNLFEILADQAGKPVGHEELTRLLWDQDYDPTTHDNKIYVSIRRLRELLEPSAVRSTMIVKDRQGYFVPFPIRKLALKVNVFDDSKKLEIGIKKESQA